MVTLVVVFVVVSLEDLLLVLGLVLSLLFVSLGWEEEDDDDEEEVEDKWEGAGEVVLTCDCDLLDLEVDPPSELTIETCADAFLGIDTDEDEFDDDDVDCNLDTCCFRSILGIEFESEHTNFTMAFDIYVNVNVEIC